MSFRKISPMAGVEKRLPWGNGGRKTRQQVRIYSPVRVEAEAGEWKMEKRGV